MKTPVLESLFNKVAGRQACNFIKNRLENSFFSVKFPNFFRTPFFTKHVWWLIFEDLIRCVFRIQSHIYDEALLQKQLMAKSRSTESHILLCSGTKNIFKGNNQGNSKTCDILKVGNSHQTFSSSPKKSTIHSCKVASTSLKFLTSSINH